MIVCQKCGFQNDDSATFCQNPSCQSFLEWEGDRVGGGGQPSPSAGQPSPSAGPSGPAPASGAAGAAGSPGSGGAGSPGSPGSGGAAGSPGTAGPADADATQPGVDAEALLAKPARAGGRPAAGQPPPVKPAEAKRPAEQSKNARAQQGPAAGEAPALKPGQRACANCGWPVEPSWRFCHHCATSLMLPKVPAEAAAGEQTSRWSRRHPPAGDRNFPADGGRRVKLLLGLVGLVAVLGVGVLAVVKLLPDGGGSSGDDSARQATTTTAIVPRVELTGVTIKEASTQSGAHVGGLTVDGKLDTYWSRQAPSPDDSPHLVYDFGKPVTLVGIEVASGAGGDEFAKRARPRQIRLVFTDNFQQRFTLEDRQGLQSVDFKPHDTSRLRIVIESTYPGSAPAPARDRTSIAEVKFLARD